MFFKLRNRSLATEYDTLCWQWCRYAPHLRRTTIAFNEADRVGATNEVENKCNDANS